MRPIIPFYILFLLAALLAPLLYTTNVSAFCYLQWGGLFAAGVIWLVNIFIQKGRTRLMWLASIVIFPLIWFLANPLFINLSCRWHITKHENELNKINAIIESRKADIDVSYCYIIADSAYSRAEQTELQELASQLDLDVMGDEHRIMYLIKSEAMTAYRAAVWYVPGDDNLEQYRLKHVRGHWYWQ